MPDSKLEYRIVLRGEDGQYKAALRASSGEIVRFGALAETANKRLSAEASKSAGALRAIGSAAKSALPAVAAGFALVVVEATRFRRVVGEIGGLLAGLAGVAAGGFAIAGVRSAIGEAAQFQASLAQVQKVAGLTREELHGVGDDIRALTKEVPLTSAALAEIAVAGGQLGLAADQYREFISLVAKSAAAFEIPAAEAGNFYGQLINNFRLTIPQVALLGDAVNALADSIANVTERDLLNVASRSAAAARSFGLTGEQLSALAASLLSTGAPAEIAATAINSVLQQLGAPETQDPKFAETLERIGISASNLKQQIGVDAQGALRGFLARIKEFDAQGQRDILGELFGRGGDSNALASLIQNLDRYDTALKSVGDATQFVGSVDRAFAIQRGLAVTQFGLLANAATRFKEAIGEPFLAAVTLAAKAITGVVSAIGDFAKANPILTQILTQIVTVAGALTVFRVGLLLLRPLFAGLATAASAVFAPLVAAFGAATGSALGLLARLSALRALLGVALGGPIGIAVGLVIALTSAFSDLSQQAVEYQGVAGTVGEFAVAAFQALGAVIGDFVAGKVKLLIEGLKAFGRAARDTVNGVIGFFVGLARAVPPVVAGISKAFRSAFSDVGRIVAAVFADVRAALSGDFSFGNLRAAIADAGQGVNDEFANLQRTLTLSAHKAGEVDYLGAAGEAITAQAREIAAATGSILRAPFDAVGNAVAGRVAANRQRAVPPAAGSASDSGGKLLPVVLGPAEIKRQQKEVLDLAQVQASASAAIFQAQLDRSRAALEASNAANLLSIEAYYRDKLKLDLDAIDAEIAARREALSRADAAERIRIEGELQALGIKRVQIAEGNLREQAETERKFSEERAALEARLLDATSRGGEARIAEIERQYALLIERLKAQGDTDGIEIAEKLFRADVANAKLDEIQARVERIVAEFRRLEDSAANRVVTGDTPPGAAQTEVRIAAGEGLEKLKAAREEIRGLAADTPLAQRALDDLDSSIEGVGDAAQTGAGRALSDLRKELASLEENFPRDAIFAFRDGLAGLFDDFIEGTKNAREAVEGFVKDLGKQILGLITQQLATRLTASLFGGLTGGLGSLFGAGVAHDGAIVGQSGGPRRSLPVLAFAGAPRLHSGGLPGLRSDEVPIIAQLGEEVLSRRDPRNALNGGLRGAVAQAGNGGTVILKIQADERLLNTRLGDLIEAMLAREAATQ